MRTFAVLAGLLLHGAFFLGGHSETASSRLSGLGDVERSDDGNFGSNPSLLVWGQEGGTSSWLMVELRAKSATVPKKVRVNTTRDNESPAGCAFALPSHDEVVYLDGVNLVGHNLTNGKPTSRKQLKDPAFMSFDYNPTSSLYEGVCQLFRTNMSETCWCSLTDDALNFVFTMPIGYGEPRSGCVGRLDTANDAFWYPSFGGVVNDHNWLVCVDADSYSGDPQWVGLINGSNTADAYVHDYKMNKSFAVQPSSKTITQLVEVIQAPDPIIHNSSFPKWLADFPEGYRLSADGLMAYDEDNSEMYLIMHHVDNNLTSGTKHYLVTVNMNHTSTTDFQPIEWPAENFQPNSMKIWS